MAPRLRVETIAFHGPGLSGLPLQAGGTPVTCAEYVRTSRRLPAALVAQQTDGHVTIRATLFSEQLAGQTVEVCATRDDGTGHAIQHVECRPVPFDDAGQSGEIDFSVVMLRGGIELDHVHWQWSFEHNGQSIPANESSHLVAIVLAEPTAPWTTGTPTCDTTLPLWEVLQHACSTAAGATTLHDAAVRITETVFGVWGGRYYRWTPYAQVFASNIGNPPAFDCLRFLGLLNGGPPPARAKVDCSDIATILSTFASILGCPVQQLALKDLCCKKVKLVGRDEWVSILFPLHEIAITVPMDRDAVPIDPDTEVWDGCLLVPGDEIIGPGDPEIALLPAGIAGTEYLKRLLQEPTGTLEEHRHRRPLSRPLGPLPNLLPTPMWDARLKEIAAKYGFDGWGMPDQTVVPIFEPVTAVDARWRALVETVFPSSDALDPDADAVARVACTWLNDPSRHVRVTLYRCEGADAARRRLLDLLGRFGEQLIPLETGRNVAFRTENHETIVGATKNVAYLIVDEGERPPVSGPDAPLVKASLTATLESMPAAL